MVVDTPVAVLAERSPEPSAAGPVRPGTPVVLPPGRPQGWVAQTARFLVRPLQSSLAAHLELGDVWQVRLLSRHEPFSVTCHPDHVRSLFTADSADAPSLTGESPLAPIVGPNSVLTSVGARHLRQRKLLLPAFHGEAVARYVEMIEAAVAREVDRWPVGEPFALAPRMQAITLEVIMSGVFGIDTRAARGGAEDQLRRTIRRLLAASTHPLYQLVELPNLGHAEPRGLMRRILATVDRRLYAVIARRRAAGADAGGDQDQRHDVLALLLQARDEEGQPLTDRELRDELLTLVLAGHETTANSLAWTFERLLRTRNAYDRLREVVRGDDADAAAGYVEATIYEGMRIRPVIPMVVRMVRRPWRLGPYVLPADSPVAISIVALHHRPDVYPDPHAFAPERFLTSKPGTYTWIPFGGGIRRCLGATLAMAEQRAVLRHVAARTDLVAPDHRSEPPRQRNVTMIPARGGRVVVERKLAYR